MNSKTKLIPLEDFLIDSLRDPEEARNYLEVVYEEFAKDKDLDALLTSLYFIAAAKDGVLLLDGKAEVDTVGLHALFKRTPNPAWEEILDALGYIFSYLSAQPIPVF